MESCCPGRVNHTLKGSGNDGSCVNYICHHTDNPHVDFRNQVKSYNGQLSRCEQTLDQQDSQFIKQLMKYPEFQKNKQSMVEQFVSKTKNFMFQVCRRIKQDNQKIKGLAKNNLETLISWKPFNLFERRQNSRYKSRFEADDLNGSRICDHDSKLLACWAVYCACWSVGDYLEEDNMARFMGLTVQDWKKSVQQLKCKIHKKENDKTIKANQSNRNKLASKNLLPSPTELSTIMIMTKKLGNNFHESVKRVMFWLCRKIEQDQSVDQYYDVIAVGVFFGVCELTQDLQGQFSLMNLCGHVRKIIYSAGRGITNELKYNDCQKLKILLGRKITPILNRYLENVYWEGKIERNSREQIIMEMMGRES